MAIHDNIKREEGDFPLFELSRFRIIISMISDFLVYFRFHSSLEVRALLLFFKLIFLPSNVKKFKASHCIITSKRLS